ncbi:MAG: autotransporter-associated beta strand repeat-containing protein [Pirellulales bacterium]|nr:autotransporter-associated beta strand repeat-containing protein [Pirellulales bacterium]
MSWLKCLSALILLEGSLVFSARAAQPVWTGGGANNYWSTSINWYGGVKPANWDYALFTDQSQYQLANLCDVPGLKLTQIKVLNPADTVVVNGLFFLGNSNGFREGGGIDMNDATRDVILNADVGFHAIQDWIVKSGRTLTATGTLFDDDELDHEKTLHKGGSGTLVLGGETNNSKVFLQVNAGVAELAKASGPAVHAVAGIKHIESGATLRLAGSGGDQIPDNAGIAELYGTFDLGGRSEGVDVISGNSGGVVTNSGAADATFTVGTDGGSCSFAGRFTDGASNKLTLQKTGAGALTPTNATSTFTGGVHVSGGTLTVGSLADQGQPSVLGSDGTIVLEGGADPATLQVTGSNVSTDRNFSVASTGMNKIKVNSGCKLTIRGSVTGAVAGAKLLKTGSGALTLSGENVFSGPTWILGGTLELAGGSTLAPAEDVSLAVATKLKISGGQHAFGNLDGLGTLEVAAGSLTASSITVPTLKIGAGAASSHPVPEPSTVVLLIVALGGGWWIFKRCIADSGRDGRTPLNP